MCYKFTSLFWHRQQIDYVFYGININSCVLPSVNALFFLADND